MVVGFVWLMREDWRFVRRLSILVRRILGGVYMRGMVMLLYICDARFGFISIFGLIKFN
jgi:hypothetical protein